MKVKQRFFAKPGEPAKAWGYCRVSHKGQFDKGNSVEDQQVRIEQYHKLRSSDPNSRLFEVAFAGIVAEPRAASAFSRSFSSRQAGRSIMEKLRPGDHLIVDKLDRIFRSLEDFVSQMRWFGERGVALHIVNFHGLSMDTGSVGGDMLLKIWAVMSEQESIRISERTSLARAARRARGQHGGGWIPFFCRLVGGEEGKVRGCGGKLEIKPEWLAMRERLCSGEKIWPLAKEKYKLVEKQRNYHLKLCKMRDFFLAWAEAGDPDVNTLKVVDFIKEYRDRRKGENR